MNAAGSKDGYLAAHYRRIAAHRGQSKALVAVQHTLLTTIWHMAHTGALYDDLGADYYTRLRPEGAKRRAIAQLEALGYTVTLDRAS